MSDTTIAVNQGATRETAGVRCLTVERGAVYRVPRAYGRLRVRAGTAWVTEGGRDLILGRGEYAHFGHRDSALVSAAAGQRLLIELW